MENDKTVTEDTVRDDADEQAAEAVAAAEDACVKEAAEAEPAEEAAEKPAAAEPVAGAEAAAEPVAKKDFGAVVASFITPERILGLIAILLIPCFFATWVHFPVTEKVGVNVELSMPQALSTGQTIVNRMQKVDDAAATVKSYANQAVDILGKVGEVASVVSAALNSDSEDYKAALKEAVGSLIDDLDVDSSKPVASSALSKVEGAANAAVDQTVDKAASSLEGTEAQKQLDEAAAVASVVDEQIDEALEEAAEVQAQAAEAKAAYESALSAAKTALGIANVVWYGFLLVLLIGGILLLVGVRGRYAMGVVAFALSSAASLAAVIGVTVVNQIAMDAVVDSLGEWVLVIVPSIMGVTAWPWVVAIASIVCLVVTCVLLSKRRKAAKAMQPAQA